MRHPACVVAGECSPRSALARREGGMIARLWHGMVPISKADEYLDLMRRIALPEYLATRGNRGAWCLHRTEADVTHFEMLTFWDDTDAFMRFAGDAFSWEMYYDYYFDYIIVMSAGVLHT